jgi:GMP synthase-like glutamine amidotransferase
MHIHCLQHVLFENAGTIADWAQQHGHTIIYTCFSEPDFVLPDINACDALLIMGGYMNVDDEAQFPWLKQEKELIRSAVSAGKKIMGICLGSQLIAAVLGARVYAGIGKEIGFYPLRFTDAALAHPFFNHFQNPYTVFHWHGDTFDLPDAATLIASTVPCKHQAYLIHDKILGLQFHFEMNEGVIEDMLTHDGHELEEKGDFISTKEAIRNNSHYLEQNKQDLFLLLDKFLRSEHVPS